MEKATAQGLIAQYLEYGEVFNRITELSYEIHDPECRKKVRKAAAEAQAQLYEGLVQTVVKEFPELEPDSQSG